MKIRLPNGLLIIDILIVLLGLVILSIPSSFLRIVFGLPFLLFFPGYVLVAALFVRKGGIDGIEKIALSFGISIAVTALIGLGLNYTLWGIRLEPVLFTISAFIFILSAMNLISTKLNLNAYQSYMSNMYNQLTMTKEIFVQEFINYLKLVDSFHTRKT